ncbi:MAG: hypothetical protein HOY71_44210, partial [Nonomuraea sp.]|nr:hypothetical protein [Nonomuraea sp.]
MLEQLVHALVSGETGLVGVVPELDGLDGSGTTTLAESACADARVRRHFTDGIGWVTVGADPFDLVATSVGRRAVEVGALMPADAARLAGLSAGDADRLLAARLMHELGSADAQEFANVAAALPGRSLIVLDGLLHPQLTVAALMLAPEATVLATARTGEGFHPNARLIRLPGWRLLTSLAERLGTPEPPCPDLSDEVRRAQAVREVLEEGLPSLGMPDSVARLIELGVFATDRNIPAGLAKALWRVSGGLDPREADLTLSGLEVLGLLRVAPDRDALLVPDPIRTYLAHALGQEGRERLSRLLLVALDEYLEDDESPESHSYLVRHLPWHFGLAGAPVEDLVCAPHWLSGKLFDHSTRELERDLSLVDTPQGMRLRRALAQSAHLLTGDHAHAVATLASRLPSLPAIARGLGEELTESGEGWLEALWEPPDLPPESLRRTFTATDAILTAVAAGPGWVAVGDEEGSVFLWRLDGTPEAWCTGHDGPVHALAVAPGGEWLASGADDGTACAWTGEGRPLAVVEHGGPVRAVAIAPDGTWFATASSDGVRAWDRDGAELWATDPEDWPDAEAGEWSLAIGGGGAW